MRTALLAVLVVLTGCNGLVAGPDASQTPSITPAPVQVTPGYPPGVTADGVVSADTLAEAHARAIDNRSYTVTSNRTVRYANGTVRSHLDVGVELATDRSFEADMRTLGHAAPTVLGRPPASATFWSNGTTYVRAYSRGGQTTYNEFSPPNEFVGTWRYWVSTAIFGGEGHYARETYESVFGTVDTRVAGRSSVDGETVYRLVGRHDRSASFVRGRFDSIRNLTVRAVVSERGVVKSLTIQYDASVDGTPITVVWTIRYDRVGTTTVERPAWFSRAVAQDSSSIPS